MTAVEIDLHGWTYDEVRDRLPNLLILHHNNGFSPIQIITGNSEKMKSVVRGVCKDHNFKINDGWDTDPGTVVIRERAPLGP